MKKLLYTMVGLFLISACQTAPCECEKETNGFGPFEGQSVYLGSQETVDVFNAIDAAWAARDYETLKSYIVDGGNFSFADGTVVTNGDDFVSYIDAEYQQAIESGSEWGWNTDYAFAAYPAGSDDPEVWNQDGQWVNAQFTSADGRYVEWYHIVDGKLNAWNQAKATIPAE